MKVLDDLFDDAKKKGSEIWGSVKNAGKQKLEGTIENLNKALPTIEEAGFELVRLDVDIALLPRIFTRFRQVKVIDEKQQKVILERTKKSKFLNFILLGLFKAVTVNEQVKIDKMDLTEIELEIGLTPSAKLIFRKTDRINLIGK